MEVSIVFWLVIGGVFLSGIIGNHFTEAKKNKLIESFVEKGQPIPPSLVQSRNLYDWRGFMVAGILTVAAGIALMVFFIALTTWAATDEDARFLPYISAFPISIGLALLLIAGFLKKNA